jgi:hypothetical protein
MVIEMFDKEGGAPGESSIKPRGIVEERHLSVSGEEKALTGTTDIVWEQ